MAPKKGKKKKSGKKRKSAKGPAIIDGISTEEMSKEQLEQHIHRLREGLFIFHVITSFISKHLLLCYFILKLIILDAHI